MRHWNDLAIFLQITRTGSVSGAARMLRIDASTASRRLAALEGEFGVRLFERAGRRLRLTESGQRLADAAIRMESIYLGETARLQGDSGHLAGTVRIGAPEGFGIACLADFLAEMASRYPELDLELVALPRDYSLARREADIAVTLDRPSSGDLSIRKLTDYSLHLYAAPAYLERCGMPGAPAELGSHTVCGYIPDLLHTRELDYAGSASSAPVRLRSTSILAQLEMIRSGRAIGILPYFLARRHPELVTVLPRQIGLLRSYWLSIHEDVKQSARNRTILRELCDHVRAQRDVFVAEFAGAPAVVDRERAGDHD